MSYNIENKYDTKILKQIQKYNLTKQRIKQCYIFEKNYKYPSLNTELLEPKDKWIMSFRINKKFRAIFIKREEDKVKILFIDKHDYNI